MHDDALIRFFTHGWWRHADYEDFLQECRLRLIQVEHRFDPAKGARSTWVKWQCRRALRDWRNGPHRDPPPPCSSLNVPAGDDGNQVEIIDLIADHRQSHEIEILDKIEREQVLEALPPRLRRTVRLRSEGYTLREVAERTGVSYQGVAVRLNAARRVLEDLNFA